MPLTLDSLKSMRGLSKNKPVITTLMESVNHQTITKAIFQSIKKKEGNILNSALRIARREKFLQHTDIESRISQLNSLEFTPGQSITSHKNKRPATVLDNSPVPQRKAPDADSLEDAFNCSTILSLVLDYLNTIEDFSPHEQMQIQFMTSCALRQKNYHLYAIDDSVTSIPPELDIYRSYNLSQLNAYSDKLTDNLDDDSFATIYNVCRLLSNSFRDKILALASIELEDKTTPLNLSAINPLLVATFEAAKKPRISETNKEDETSTALEFPASNHR